MKTFRKISLTVVMFALVILALHALVPHHHQPLGTDFICTTHNHHTTSCTKHIECVDSAHKCDGDMMCGLSHTFLANAEHSEITPMSVECQSVIPEPDIIKRDSYFIEYNTSAIQEFIWHCVPLRAPPVA